MAQHHWLAQAHAAEAAVLVVMQVRSANTASGDAHAQLPGGEGLRFVLGADPQVFRGMADNRLHKVLRSYSDAVMPPST